MKKKTVKLYDVASHRYFNAYVKDIADFAMEFPKGFDSHGNLILEHWIFFKKGTVIHYLKNKNPQVAPRKIQINVKSWSAAWSATGRGR